jgi:small subunit ribosomal protein S15
MHYICSKPEQALVASFQTDSTVILRELNKFLQFKRLIFTLNTYLCRQNNSQNNRRSNGTSFKKTTMPVTKEKKASIFTNYAGTEKNTGSIEGQIALLTERMAQISAHLGQNKKDFSTHRGLMQLVGKRRRLLNYLQKHNLQSYRSLIEKLGIRK